MPLKESERLAIIVEYIKSGTVPDGYKIVEKDGSYRVQRTYTKEELLRKRISRLQRKLDELNKQVDAKIEEHDDVADSSSARDEN